MKIDPRSATPCRTVAFTDDQRYLVEANYLGFVTIRRAVDGEILRRFLAQTALVETIRLGPKRDQILLVGAGFEGRRDDGVVKIISLHDGHRIAELAGHRDDVTDVMPLPGSRRRIVSIGLDFRVIVHDLDDAQHTWIWGDYTDYLNTCAARPHHDGHFAISGDSPFSYVLDASAQRVVAKLESPGDTNGLLFSSSGRFLLVGDDFGTITYFDADRDWKMVGEHKVGGAAKRMVADPASPDRILVACYDGRIWSVPETCSTGSDPWIAMDRRPGLWGINLAATRSRLALPSFMDRAYLLARDSLGRGSTVIGARPEPTFGCNWITVKHDLLAISHDDGRIRLRDIATGSLRYVLGPDTGSLYMGGSFHPSHPLLAVVDFYGEVLIYDIDHGRVVWRRDMGFGPGITVDFSRCGEYLAVGGYGREGRIFRLSEGGHPIHGTVLEAPNRSVIKNLTFTAEGSLLTACGDGSVIIHRRDGDRWHAAQCIRTTPGMELSNAVSASPDGRILYVASRDQTLRAFDTQCGQPLGVGFGHTRSVKSVHMSDCGRFLATGAYDRTSMLWDPTTLTVRLPPQRGANSGISCVRVDRGHLYSCSFDGVVTASDAESGRSVWTVNSHDVAEGR